MHSVSVPLTVHVNEGRLLSCLQVQDGASTVLTTNTGTQDKDSFVKEPALTNSIRGVITFFNMSLLLYATTGDVLTSQTLGRSFRFWDMTFILKNGCFDRNNGAVC